MEAEPDSNTRAKKNQKIPSDYSLARVKISMEQVLFAVFALLVANIIAFGYISHQNYSKHLRLDMESQLATIADLKSNEIRQYIMERLGDGNMFFRRRVFYETVQRFFENPEDAKNTGYLRDWLSRYSKNYRYVDISIADTTGAVRFSTLKAGGKFCCSAILKLLPEMLDAKRVRLGDFCRSDQDNHICLSILVPILDEDKNSRPLGVLALRIDPEAYLYPLIKKWPVPSETAETLLVRRDGNDVVFLNELRFKKDTALNLRFPIDTNKDLPAIKAILGQTGIVYGRDYRGVPVVAYVDAVTDSPWFMVARVDVSEVRAPIHRQLIYITWLVIAAIIAISMIAWVIWRRRTLLFYKERYFSAETQVRDIAERIRLEEDLAQAKETQYRTLIESLPQKVFLKDRNSVYVSCNENYAKDLKIKPEECAGKTDYDFFPTYLAEKYREDDKRIMESGETENIEEEYVMIKDFLRGAQKSVINIVKVPVRDKKGNVTGLFGLFWDITEHKKAENELKTSEEKFRVIFNDAIDGIALVNPGNKRFFMANRAFCDSLGYSQGEIEDLTVMDIHPEADLPRIIDVFEKQMRREISMAMDIPVKRKDGSIFYADINSSYLEIAGDKYLVGFFRDVTESKLVKEEARRVSEVKIAADMKSKFTSMVSHELRSPMAVIKESINIVLEGLVGGVTPDQKDVLETARSNVDRLGRLINNVLDFQKIEAGKMELDMKEYDINEVVLAVSKEINLLAEEKGLSFTVNTDESMPSARFDKDKIVQVLTNLLSNAIKFTEKRRYLCQRRAGR